MMLVRYESKRLELDHYLFNIPDHGIESLSSMINKYKIAIYNLRDLENAGVGKRPYVIIAYSMGGVVSRSMILNNDNRSNLKGIAFIGSPLV